MQIREEKEKCFKTKTDFRATWINQQKENRNENRNQKKACKSA